MSVIDNVIADETGYAPGQQNGQAGSSTESTAATVTVAPGNPVAPLLQLEKTDIEFWVSVAQLVVLIMILRELRGGGAS